MTSFGPSRSRLFVALDVPTVDHARALVERLGDDVSSYKVGLELLFGGGLAFAAGLKAAGKQFRLKGKGMPVLRSKVQGDMYIQVEVETPKHLTRRQRELLEEFDKESKAENNPASSGFFTRVKEFFEGKGA